MSKHQPRVATIILAGGNGARLNPLTLRHCKAAAVYGGSCRLIDIAISNSIRSGFQEIFVITPNFSDELEKYVRHIYPSNLYPASSIEFLAEQGGGSANAVRDALPTILKSSADYFFILASDLVYTMDFRSMYDFARSKKADLTLACTPVLEKEARRMG